MHHSAQIEFTQHGQFVTDLTSKPIWTSGLKKKLFVSKIAFVILPFVEQRHVNMGEVVKARDAWPALTSLSALSIYARETLSVSLTIILLSNCYLPICAPLCTVRAKDTETEREGGSEHGEGRGRVVMVVDNVCKFVRVHRVLCNKNRVLLLFAHLLSSPGLL